MLPSRPAGSRAGVDAPFPNRVLALCGGIVTIGGAEKMIIAALGLLRANGSHVHCIVNDWQNDEVASALESVGATWSAGSYRNPLRLRGGSVLNAIGAAGSTVGTSAGLLAAASRFQPNLVFASDYGSILRNAAALALLRAMRIPVVLYMQNSPPRVDRYDKLFRRVIDRLVTRYVCASHHSCGELEHMGIASNKIGYTNNFALELPRRATSADRNPKLVVFAGQMIPQKGLDLLLEAFAVVASADAEARLEIASRIDGWIAPEYHAYRERILSRAQNADLAGRVKFVGWSDDVPSMLARAGIHCSASLPEMYEGMPIVCLEAKVAGTPSVVPASGPFPELVTHLVDGWLCPDYSVEAFAAGLEYFLADPARARRAGLAALESSARFSQREFADRWKTEIAVAISGRKGAVS